MSVWDVLVCDIEGTNSGSSIPLGHWLYFDVIFLSRCTNRTKMA
jgi:hypothetical protein